MAKQIKYFYENGVNVTKLGTIYLKIKDLLKAYGMDDSTYYYCLNKLEKGCPRQTRASIIANAVSGLNTAISNFDSKIHTELIIQYRHMGYFELLPEVNDVLKIHNIKPISVSTLKRDLKKFDVKTPWQMFHKNKSKSGTSYGKSDNRYVTADERAKLLYLDLSEWNNGNVEYTNNLISPLQVLCIDIKELKWGKQKNKLYLTLINDEFTGKDVGYSISTGLTALETTISAVENMELNYPNHSWLNTMMHSDRGSQMACKMYYKKVKGLGLIISMSPAGTPNRNPVAESRFSKTSINISDLLLNAKTKQEAIAIIEAEIAVNSYNKRKFKCNYLTSSQFEKSHPIFDSSNPEIIEMYRQVSIALN